MPPANHVHAAVLFFLKKRTKNISPAGLQFVERGGVPRPPRSGPGGLEGKTHLIFFVSLKIRN
jgi:hypothetical protein